MTYAVIAVERAMKLQEVMLRAMSGELSWLQAADMLGMHPRSLRRWRARQQRVGYDGLLDRRRQRPSPRLAPFDEVERILRLYRDRYRGFNVRHFHQLLRRDEATIGIDGAGGAARARSFHGMAEVSSATAKMRLVPLADEIIAVLSSDPNAAGEDHGRHRSRVSRRCHRPGKTGRLGERAQPWPKKRRLGVRGREPPPGECPWRGTLTQPKGV
jgi:hypothetical protein